MLGTQRAKNDNSRTTEQSIRQITTGRHKHRHTDIQRLTDTKTNRQRQTDADLVGSGGWQLAVPKYHKQEKKKKIEEFQKVPVDYRGRERPLL